MRRTAKNYGMLGLVGALALMGCEREDPVLTGERLDVRDVLQTRLNAADTAAGFEGPRAISLPAQASNDDWAQSPVSPHMRTTHAAFSGQFQPVFSVGIGAGDSRRARLNADPVAGAGRIFTLDSAHRIQATGTDGSVLWSRDLTPPRDNDTEAQGGGLAIGADALYVATGFGTLSALNPETGAEIWSQRLGNTATGAPSLRDGVLYVLAGDQTGWALEADTGLIRWQTDGVGDSNNVAGAPAPAIGPKRVIFSSGTGGLQAVFRQGGLRLWNADLLGRRNGVALAGIDDVTGDPLIAGNVVYAGNHSGRFVALDLASGERLWTAREGALGPAWPVGDSVFFVSDRNQLLRLDAATGDRIWAADLPGYVPTRRNPSKRRDVAFANLGPILAGGRLIVAGSDGMLRAFDPESGAQVAQVDIPGGATTRPIVANGTLYVVSTKGVLHAFR
jgi:outer membrane protein assembly factor BamB